MTPADRARIALTDTTVAATLAPAAVAAMEAGAGGYPEQTPGASPAATANPRECRIPDCDHMTLATCQLHDGTSGGTPVDIALRDLDNFKEHVRKLAHHAREAALLASRWAYQGIDDTTIKARLVAIDSEIWCANCSRFGRHEPRKPGKPECDFCDGFRERRFKRGNGGIWQAPPKELWDARDARNGRLDETTIARILRNVETARKALQATAKAEYRATRKVS